MHTRSTREHGFILPTVLAILALLVLLGTTMLVKSSSELKQAGMSQGQAQARGYAEAAQADMFYYVANPGLTAVNAIFAPYAKSFTQTLSDSRVTPIIPTSAYPTILAALETSFVDISTSGKNYTTTSSITFRALRADPGSFNANGQSYYLDYSVIGKGTAGLSKRTVTTEGTIRINLGRQSLNQFILLANDGGSGTSSSVQGFFDTSSTYDGPVHVNKNWALTGKPTFLAGASVSDSYVWMNDAKACSGYAWVKVSGKQASPGGCTVPNTNGNGLQYSTDVIDMPKNAQSQARAALGLDATIVADPPVSTICTQVGLPSTCGSVTPGTYIPNKAGAVSGGIYIQGDADVKLSVSGTKQVYVIKANNVTTTITVDYAAKTTTYVKGTAAPVVLNGVPNGQLYSSGNITGLSGPPRTGILPVPPPSTSVPSVVPPALASATQLNVAASGAVTVSGDVTYTDDPRTVTGATNVLGIISGTGSVLIGDTAPNDVYVQGAILSGASGAGLSVPSRIKGQPRGSIHMLGSLAEDMDALRGTIDNYGKLTAGYSDDFKFDQRFFNGAVSPPFFPATTQFVVQTGWPIQRTWTEQ